MKTEFQFGRTFVHILQGDILNPGVTVDAVASTDDNYLTMGSGVSASLRGGANSPDYVRVAQANTPIKAGSVVVTPAYQLEDPPLGAKHVLHGTVIDYDSDETPLGALVELTTLNCLRQAEALGCHSVLLPAFGSGAGKLEPDECARHMASAIKIYLAQERPLTRLYIILYLPEGTEEARAPHKVRNESYIRQANLILATPYDPRDGVRQARDFHGSAEIVQELTDVLLGSCDKGGKSHAVILGGPIMGKSALLDHLYHTQFEAGSPLADSKRLIRLTFGNIHPNTPRSFVYRKLLSAMLEEEYVAGKADQPFVTEIRNLYADEEITSDKFLNFLKGHAERYPEVVFLIDKLPALLGMEAEKDRGRSSARQFWADLDQLQTRVRFIYTARDDEDYRRLREERLETMTTSFKNCVREVRVRCLTDEERRAWVNDAFERYLDDTEGTPQLVQDFVAAEAGRHPYLIGLTVAELANRVKAWQLEHPDLVVGDQDEAGWEILFQQMREAIAPARADFCRRAVDQVAADPHREDLLWEMERLAEAEHAERSGRPDEGKAVRKSLHAGPDNNLQWLEHRGLVVNSESADDARFVSSGLSDYVHRRLSAGVSDRPGDVTVSLLCPEPDVIRTIFQARSAQSPMADNLFTEDDKQLFMKNYLALIDQRFRGGEPGDFADIQAVSQYILTQFTDDTIKDYLRRVPDRSTFSLLVEESYKEIPWELMLEAAYEGEIPFQVGRSIIGRQVSLVSPPVRGRRGVKTLLIGNPTGDLPEAEDEVNEIASLLKAYPKIFEAPRVLQGKANGGKIQILSALSAGYDLIHYSGHTKFAGSQSAWHVADGEIPTSNLTKALKNPKAVALPALVFSSSCESATAAPAQALKYEAQALDLPGAFLNAGVEAYIGSLWPVEEMAARSFAVDFYSHFILSSRSEPLTIGECLRRARWQLKQEEAKDERGPINWLAFVLYGDPRVMPGDLFPIMKPAEA